VAQTLLIVEDDPEIMEILKIILADAGFNTVSSQYGFDVEELIAQNNPDLLLMDIRLGELDGRKICKSLKSGPHAKIPVILMSAHALANEVMNDACADAFIEKPFDIYWITKLIANTLSLSIKKESGNNGLMS
jgi:two-component system phosphate regulon response regulator PhoB